MRERLRIDVVSFHRHHSCCEGQPLTYHQWSGVTIICVLQRKTAKGMGMMRSPSAASLAAGQQNVLPHKVRNFEILTYLVTSLSMIIRFVIVRGVTYIKPVVSST